MTGLRKTIRVGSSETDTSHLGGQRTFGRACAPALSRLGPDCLHIQSKELEEASEKEPEIWSHWIDAHTYLREDLNLHGAKVIFS